MGDFEVVEINTNTFRDDEGAKGDFSRTLSAYVRAQTCRRNAYETSNALSTVHQNANVFYPRG